MLGDTGSNLVGALAGVAMLVTLGGTGRLDRAGAGRLAHDLRGVSVDLADDRAVPLLRCLDSLGRVSEGDLKR